jgi:hypothetical protein
MKLIMPVLAEKEQKNGSKKLYVCSFCSSSATFFCQLRKGLYTYHASWVFGRRLQQDTAFITYVRHHGKNSQPTLVL